MMSETTEDSCTMAEGSTASPALAGNILPFIDKFLITREEAKEIFRQLAQRCEWQDIFVIACVGWLLIPSIQLYYDLRHNGLPFRESRLFHITNMISQMGQIALLVYFVDMLDIARATVGISFMDTFDLPATFAKLAYTAWVTHKLARFKQYMLMKFMAESKQRVGLAHLIDHMMDGMLACVTMFYVIDILDIEGAGLKSAITFGSAGTLAFTLASQSIVSAIVNGFALSASNRFYVGEFVKFGDGTSGTVVNLGWMETVLRSSDDLVVAVPNTQLAGQRVSNLSRNNMCQVKLTLRFHYEDLEALPELANTIKDEIKASCTELISDGSRPFRVVIDGLCDTHVEMLVDTHYTLPPIGDLYANNKQKVIMAVHGAVKKHDLQFAILKFGSFRGVLSRSRSANDDD